jgi:GT2 family glycosyltransferase
LNVIVVDNGSRVDPTSQIKANYPSAEVVRLQRNLGFAAGCNAGITKAIAAGVDYILLLNNDVIVRENLFNGLRDAFAADEKAGIVCPLIYATDQRTIDFAGANINFALGRFKHVQMQHGKNSEPFGTDFISGACMMLSRAAVDGVGMLDEGLFAYFEDVDLCLRARNAGFKLLCTPTAIVIHKGSASTRRGLQQGATSPLKHYLIARNRTILVRRYASPPAKLFYVFVATPLRLAFYTSAFVVKCRWKKLHAFWRGTIDGLRVKSGRPPEFLFS